MQVLPSLQHLNMIETGSESGTRLSKKSFHHSEKRIKKEKWFVQA